MNARFHWSVFGGGSFSLTDRRTGTGIRGTAGDATAANGIRSTAGAAGTGAAAADAVVLSEQ